MIRRLIAPVLIAGLCLAAATDSEWWPVSSMRLFSRVRGPTATAWEVRAEPSGDHFDVAGLGRGFRGAHHLVPRMQSMEAGERDSICRAWIRASGNPAITALRVERVTYSVPRRDGERRRVLRRLEAFRCG